MICRTAREGLTVMQDTDPHHMHVEYSYLYYFLVLGVIVGIAGVYFGMKLMNYLDKRKKSGHSEVKTPGTESGDEGSLD